MIRLLLALFLFTIFSIFQACEEKLSEQFIEKLDELKPDRRTVVYELQYERHNGMWVFNLETSDQSYVSSLSELVEEFLPENTFRIDSKILPDSVLGDTLYGVVNVSVANLRRSPRHSAELVDQVLFGMPLKLLKKDSYWYLVQTPYDYLGWVTRGSMKRMTFEQLSEYKDSDRVVLIKVFEQILSEPIPGSSVIADAVEGCVFRTGEKKGNWIEITLPDGRNGYLPILAVKEYISINNNPVIDRQEIVRHARSLMGIPYLWGGHSTKGMDCSGFTSTVFRTYGYQLPRDANMQVNIGKEVIPDSSYSNVFPGDLIFFGSENRITHVGISLGGSYFIHSSDDVHVNSLDENDNLFNAYRKRTFRLIKRIIED